MLTRSVLIVFSGLPGVGKTTLASAFAAKREATYLRVDVIEQALLNEEGQNTNLGGRGYAILCALAESNLQVGLTVVADCVNPWPLTRTALRAAAERAGADMVNIEIVCFDRNEHRRRVEARQADILGHRMPTWADVEARDYRPWTEQRLQIDTTMMAPEAALEVIAAYISER